MPGWGGVDCRDWDVGIAKRLLGFTLRGLRGKLILCFRDANSKSGFTRFTGALRVGQVCGLCVEPEAERCGRGGSTPLPHNNG